MRPPDLDAHDDLAWTAFAYAAGELPPAEAERFERRLDADQAAREAVAEAVLLVQALHRAGPVATIPFPGRRRRVLTTLAAAAALAMAVGLGWRALRPEPEPRVDEGVVLAWSGLMQDETNDWLGDVDEPAADPPAGLAASPSPERDAEPESGDAFPAWLLEAASLPTSPPQDAHGS